MQTIVSKFGGSSLATPDRVRAVADIVRANPSRKYVVVSAPGRRTPDDRKVTDLLIAAALGNRTRQDNLATAYDRMFSLAKSLSVPSYVLSSMASDFTGSSGWAVSGNSDTYHAVLALGEKWMARILAHVLNWDFADAEKYIRFDADDRYDVRATEQAFRARPLPPNTVVPGFYGGGPTGICTFSRNGSDISGAIVARMTGAGLYENWTDTDGLLSADPRIVPDACPVPRVSRIELQELAYRGTSVLHGDSLFPLHGTSVPVVIKNTLNPSFEGTRIEPELERSSPARGSVVGIAGRAGFAIIQLSKAGMNRDLGFLANLCSAFATEGVSIELMPGGIDTQTVIVSEEALDGRETALELGIRGVCQPDAFSIERNSLALLCIVGEAMSHQHGVLARAATALAENGINVRIADQGASETSIILGIHSDDYENAMRAVHRAFFP